MKQSGFSRHYARIRRFVGFLAVFRLILWAFERFTPTFYATLTGLPAKLPAPVLALPALLQKQAWLWPKWLWFWDHCWIVFVALLLLPNLKAVLEFGPMLRDIALTLVRVCRSVPRALAGWIIRMRCRGVTLENCQFVIVRYLDGTEQIVNIREVKSWDAWEKISETPPVLQLDDNGVVSLRWNGQDGLVLRDRLPLTTDELEQHGFSGPEGLESITLFDDRRR